MKKTKFEKKKMASTISKKTKDLTEDLYERFGTHSGIIFGIPSGCRQAVEWIIQFVIDEIEEKKNSTDKELLADLLNEEAQGDWNSFKERKDGNNVFSCEDLERLCRKAMKASREETAQEIFKELRQRGHTEKFESFLGDTLHRFVMGLPILDQIEEMFKGK